jgi:hypothetical protein
MKVEIEIEQDTFVQSLGGMDQPRKLIDLHSEVYDAADSTANVVSLRIDGTAPDELIISAEMENGDDLELWLKRSYLPNGSYISSAVLECSTAMGEHEWGSDIMLPLIEKRDHTSWTNLALNAYWDIVDPEDDDSL